MNPAAGPAPQMFNVRAEPERALAEAAAALRAGGVVLVPTDTVYGLAALSAAAVEDLFDLKGRPADRSIAVLVADRSAAESLAESVPAPLAELMNRHWPGPLTVVLPRRQASGSRLGGDAETVGVRCPDHPWLRRLLAEVGPLAVTSANRHAPRRRRFSPPSSPTRGLPPPTRAPPPPTPERAPPSPSPSTAGPAAASLPPSWRGATAPSRSSAPAPWISNRPTRPADTQMSGPGGRAATPFARRAAAASGGRRGPRRSRPPDGCLHCSPCVSPPGPTTPDTG